jgi:hypothetical protein
LQLNAKFARILLLLLSILYEDESEGEIILFEVSSISNFERLRSMLSLKEMWSPSRIRAEAGDIENHLFNTTQRLKRLERQYRSKKMEYLAKIETYEERLKWVTAEME